MKYRAEVDGLRAIAIVPVLFFHAGFSFFHGGFLGVDIFFVISGYLITGILLSDHESNSFSITQFYERRMRRIMPALFLVIASSLVAAWWIMPPSILKEFSRSIAAVLLFLSNFYFIFKSGYFDADIELNPMLHTWSLAVEEQYYVFFPLLILLIWRLRLRYQLVALIVFLVASLLLANGLSSYNANASFYLPFTRAWELLFGALVAYYATYGKGLIVSRPSWNSVLSGVGVVLVLLSFYFFDENTLHPSYLTVFPVLGTSLILLFANSETVVGRILSQRWLVFIGLISYPLYLWHQPIFAFVRLQAVTPPSALHYSVGIVISAILAWLTTRYVERFTRDKKHFTRAQIFQGVALCSAIIMVACVAIERTGGFNYRNGELAVKFSKIVRADQCFNLPDAHQASQTAWGCEIHESAPGKIQFMVVGDSHNLSVLPAFEWIAKQSDVKGFFTGYQGCPPLLGAYLLNRKDQFAHECFALNEKIAQFAREQAVTDIFLVARWTYYTDGDYDGSRMRFIGSAVTDSATIEHSRNTFDAAISRTVDFYQRAGIRVHVIRQVPMQAVAAKNIYWKAKADDVTQLNHNLRLLSVDRAKFDAFMQFNDAAWQRHPSIHYIDLADNFCDAEKCLVGTDRESYYSDSNHLTTDGAYKIKDALYQHYLNTRSAQVVP